MFLPAVFSVLAVVALGPQVVLGSFKFNLSPVVQCEPVNITFAGGNANNHSVPTTLTILPLVDNALPIKIAIPNAASNSTGIQLTFIPLPKNTLFIASFDDIEGPLATVSDVTKVAPPTDPTAAATCFGNATPFVNFYQLVDTPSQCETFTVAYNISAPTIRAFLPRLGSTNLTLVNSTGPGPGTATYTMSVIREEEVAMLFDDGQGHVQTTGLITVGGDSSSPNSCFPKSSGSSKAASTKTKSKPLPQAAAIGIAVAATIIGLVAILLLLYFLRERRRRRLISDMEFNPTLLNRPSEKEPMPSFIAPPPFSAGGGFVHDPIYTREKYATSVMSDVRTSMGSWVQFVPADQRSEQSPRSRPASGSSRLSMDTLDVQDILQMATVHRDRTSGDSSATPRQLPQPSMAGATATTFNVAKPAVARLVPLRRRMSDPADMPVTALSRDDSARAVAAAALPSGYGPSSYGQASYMASGPPDMPVTALSRGDSARAVAAAALPSGYGPSSYGQASYMTMGDTYTDDGHSMDQGIGGFPVPAFALPSNPRDTSESWGNVVVR
ncbi:hypothetical protein B0H17DRAFT_1206996 [Mycena rosella]|uniref:Uncharacterized protein n=1 Tax=Mycena rosella TaxID=1033263 RepID=A0AAD7D3P4_MYCRO|nr:hypothetical protein B0H17DRAFT_1206996 [Mycena rosella]